MSELSNEPVIPESGAEMSLVQTWIAAFTKPKEATFAQIIRQPRANLTNAFLWVFVASLITSFASLIAQAVNVGGQMAFQEFLPPEIAREIPIGATPSIGFGTVICGAPIGAIVSVLFFAIFTAVIQWVAKLFGGTGTFEKLAYSFSTITVPYSIVAAVLMLLGIIPFVGILTGLLSLALGIYVIVLEVFAVKVVNGLDTAKAAGAVLLPAVVIFFFVCCCLIIGVTVMGAAIGDVFNEIQQGLSG